MRKFLILEIKDIGENTSVVSGKNILVVSQLKPAKLEVECEQHKRRRNANNHISQPRASIIFYNLTTLFCRNCLDSGQPQGSKVITVCKTSHLKIKTVFQKESFCSPESDTMILREYRFCLLKASALIQTESEKK